MSLNMCGKYIGDMEKENLFENVKN